MFRCCLPCRGGPTQAPATSPPSSPESENFTGLYADDSLQDDRPGSVTTASIRYETQTSPLPHIEEEEELDASHHTSPEDCNSLSEQLIASQKSIRIVDQQASSRNQTAQRHSIGTGTGGDDAPIVVSNSPSPRAKQSRKQTKGRNKSITSTTSSETATSGGAVVNLNSVSASATVSAVVGLLLPKMQAEQGSIGDLQKYHSRYLKNRRHTLANVR